MNEDGNIAMVASSVKNVKDDSKMNWETQEIYNDAVQKEKEFNSIGSALSNIRASGYNVNKISNGEIQFKFEGEVVKYFPRKGWATGKTIVDCRGLDRLLLQIKY